MFVFSPDVDFSPRARFHHRTTPKMQFRDRHPTVRLVAFRNWVDEKNMGCDSNLLDDRGPNIINIFLCAQ